MLPAWTRVTAILRAACLAGSFLTLASGDATAAQPPSLSITAGVGGLVKAGRWVPVQVAVNHTGGDIDGELVVSFGTATVRRRIELSGQSSRRLELYIRSPEAANVVTAQLRAGSSTVARAEAAVRPLANTERVVLCVEGSAPADGSAACSASLAVEALPRSLRGYEAVDAIELAGAEPQLTDEQRAALAAWRELQSLNQTGDLGLVEQPTRPTLPRGLPPGLLRVVAILAALYAGTILAVGRARTMPRRPFRHGYVVLAAIVLGGSLAAIAVGAGLTGGAIVVHHATVVEQLPRSSTALVTIRGIVEFPARKSFDLRWPMRDAMLEPSSTAGGPEQSADADGYPVLAGLRGLGTRQAFGGESIYLDQVVSIDTTGATTTAANRSTANLRDCAFADGFEPRQVGELAPGASASATQVSPTIGPVLTCTLDGMLVPFAAVSADVVSRGTTVVAAYR